MLRLICLLGSILDGNHFSSKFFSLTTGTSSIFRKTTNGPTNSYTIMQNENGENVDLYVPRKCSWTNRLIRAKDHGSVQINVANVDPVTGLYTGESTAFALAGYIRDKSEGDMAFTALVEANDKKMLASQE